uniref:Nuclear cap-binding protein subunit 2 n=1 Tax=Canis lupus dingo TaxID=286419 RepID=A0A8C0JRV5_CANLU
YLGGLLIALCSDSCVELSWYWDQPFQGDSEEQEKLLKIAVYWMLKTFPFTPLKGKIYELFSRSGGIKKIMKDPKMKTTACGFCFVEYHSRAGAENAMRYMHGTHLGDGIIHADWDAGFKEEQARDEYWQDNDAERGGYGKLAPN